MNKKSQSGQLMIIVALSMVVFIGFAALAVDLGRAYSERRLAQNAADEAALAGLRLVRQQASPPALDGNAIYAAILSEARKSGGSTLTLASAQFFNTSGSLLGNVAGWTADYTNVSSLQVKTSIQYQTFFAGILGMSSMTSTAIATAKSYEVSDNAGLLPLALQTKAPGNCTAANYGWTLSGAGNLVDIPFGVNNPGNFGWVDFSNSNASASTIRGWIENGYTGPFNYFYNLNQPDPPPAKKGDPWSEPAHNSGNCDGWYQDGNAGGSGTWDVTPPNPYPDNPIPDPYASSPTDVPYIEWFSGRTGIDNTLIAATEPKVPGDFTIMIFNKIDKGGTNARYQIIGLAAVHLTQVTDGKDGKHLLGTYGGTTFGGVPTPTACVGPQCTIRLAPGP